MMKRAFSLLLILCLLISCSALGQSEGAFYAADDSASKVDFSSGEKTDGTLRTYEDLAVSGSCVWHVSDGVIRCTDVHTQQLKAELPLSSLYPETESYLALTSFHGSVMLCVATNAGGECRVSLYHLVLQEKEIICNQAYDATEKLSYLFDRDAEWMEVDLTFCAGGLLISALDQDRIFRLSLYDPAGQKTRDLGSVPLFSYTGVFAFGDDILLMGPTEQAPEDEILTRILAATGERETLGTVRTGSMTSPCNLALNEEEQILYFFSDGIGFRAAIGGTVTPEAFCIMPDETALLRYASFSEKQYIFQNVDTSLLFRDTTETLKAETLRILSLEDSDPIQNILQSFNSSNPDYLCMIVNAESKDDILNAVMNQSADYDGFIINLGSDLYRSLSAKGYLADLGSNVLLEAVEPYPDRIRSRILKDGKLTAFPVGIRNSVMMLDVAAVTKLTGLSREELPKDWIGFLKLLGLLGESGLADSAAYRLYESGVSADAFRVTLIAAILQDAMLWLDQDESRLSALQMTLTPVLQELDRTDWTLLGLPEENETDTDWTSDDEKTPLLEWVNPEIAVTGFREGAEFWPLSLSSNENALVPQDVAVLVSSSWSRHPEGMVRIAETLCREMDIITRMELDQSLNEPVKNLDYNEDIEYIRTLIPLYEEAISTAKDEESAAELQEELDDLLDYLASYEKLGAWLVSADSIALYRPLEDLFAVHGDEFWDDENESALFLQYVDGMLSADQFVFQLANMIKMSRMETE